MYNLGGVAIPKFAFKFIEMQKHSLIAILLIAILTQTLSAQEKAGLRKLPEQAIDVYYSAEHEMRTRTIAKRVVLAKSFYQGLLGFTPEVSLLVLSKEDWSRHTNFPVYGMPHYSDNKTLIIAAEDNPLWQSFIPPMEKLPATLQDQIRKVYTTSKGELSMQPFFDLLALHELGHAFHLQDSVYMQRSWMGELFVNMLLHAFIAENEKESLPALTIFPEMVIAAGSKEYTYTSLHDVDQRYTEIATKHPKNYGWYQSRWHAGAARIYDSAGKEASKKLWLALKSRHKKLSDQDLLLFLDNVDRAVGNLVRNWDVEH